MTQLVATFALIGFTGVAILLIELPWIRRPSLYERLSPYAPDRQTPRQGLRVSAVTVRDVLQPLAYSVGARISSLTGIDEDLETRLRRFHSPHNAEGFRLRQAGWTGAALVAGVSAATLFNAPAALAVLLSFGAPTLTFLVIEQKVIASSERWQRQIFLELPVITEQLGMLVSAGWSLGAAINRIASRGDGACATDLRVVAKRIRHGLSDVDALREWAEVADVEALSRLVSILALNRQTSDLGSLISTEGRAIRRDAQRELIEVIERRQQQVWIPVTVAALVPGVLLMGVPFVDALRLFEA